MLLKNKIKIELIIIINNNKTIRINQKINRNNDK